LLEGFGIFENLLWSRVSKYSTRGVLLAELMELSLEQERGFLEATGIDSHWSRIFVP